MKKNKLVIKLLILFLAIFTLNAKGNEDFFNQGKEKFDNKMYEESKFLMQRNIVFNPKDDQSYLYLAKIFKKLDQKKEIEKNLDTSLLLNPKNEEALYMLMELELDKSNFLRVVELINQFELVCLKLCDKKKEIKKNLKNIEINDESK